MKDRSGWKWKTRWFVGSIFTRLSWRILDPHDSWLIDYRQDGHACCRVCKGFHSQARAVARELNGRISGCSVTTVSAEDEGDHPSNAADWWKKGPR